MTRPPQPVPQIDDPAHEEMIREFIRDGDWTRNLDHPLLLERAARLRLDLDRVRSELAFLFPPALCLDLARRSEPMHMATLFVPGILPTTDSMLLLGHDLDACRGWREKSKLVSDLRDPSAFSASRFEVGAWGALARAGLEVEYERPSSTNGKIADYFFDEDSITVALEAKAFKLSRRDANRSLVLAFVRDLVLERAPDGTAVTYRASERLIRACDVEEFHVFESRFPGRTSEAIAWTSGVAQLPDGAGELPGLGTLDVRRSDTPGMEFTSSNLDEDALSVSAKRAVRLVLQGSEQVHAQRDAAVRAVVVAIPRWRMPIEETAAYVQQVISGMSDTTALQRLDAIVLVNALPRGAADVMVCRFRWSRPGVERMRWVGALSTIRLG